MSRFSPFTRRLLALVFLLAAIYLPYLLLVAPIIAEHHRIQAEIKENLELIQRYRMIAADRVNLEEQLSLAQDDALPSQYYLPGDNPALVAASLQNQIKMFAENAGGKLLSTQLLPPQFEKGLTRILVRVQMTGTVDSFYKTLYAVESSRPALFVETVDLNTRQIRRRHQSDAEDTELMAGFDVYGYLQPQ